MITGDGGSAGALAGGLVGGGAAGPSLVPRRESVFEIPSEICPKKPYWLTALERPSLRFPASCDSYGCPKCGPRKAEQVAALMTWSIRQAAARGTRARFLTFTNAPDEWQPRRQKLRGIRRWARDQGYEWEIGWATERGSQTGMVHVHGIQHGDQKIPQAALQDRWGAIVDIRAVKTPGAGVYAVKDALRVAGYAMKNATADHEGLLSHLDLNGGRAAHWSRGFLHGLTKREALSQARAELSDGEVMTWALIPAWTR